MGRKVAVYETTGRQVVIRRDAEYGEFSCTLYVHGADGWEQQDAATYYTDDRADALATAQQMLVALRS